MRFSRPKRLRTISVTLVLLVIVGLPAALAVGRFLPGAEQKPSGVFAAYTSGFTSLGVAAIAASILAAVFALWLVANQRHQVNRRFLAHSARRHHGLVEISRMLAIILGTAGLVIGSLFGLYAALIHIRPELQNELPLPLFTPQLALTGLIGGGVLYAAGRIGRY